MTHAVCMTRLSVATWPPPDVVRAVERLPRPAHPRVTWSQPAHWLVKLRPLGTVPDRLIAELVEALHGELALASAARCTLGPTTRRLGGQWLGVPVSGLDDLSAMAFDATAGIVPVTHPQPFQADIVIARGHVPAAFAGEPISGEWIVRTAALVADRSSPGRPKFVNLAEFPLLCDRLHH